MKNITAMLFCAALFLPATLLSACVSATPPAASPPEAVSFTAVEGVDWRLLEVRRAGGAVRLDWEQLDSSGFGGAFSITFAEGSASGMGAPNRFFGPYTLGGGMSISMGNMASTLMMPLVEPDDLREHEFFAYLSRVSSWNIRQGMLELFSSGGDGSETVLVFARQ
ncbi:MAG: META domain-containing protein [Treponema sp.]|nr:META domain-containing protein [Treponema sp.]